MWRILKYYHEGKIDWFGESLGGNKTEVICILKVFCIFAETDGSGPGLKKNAWID